MRSSTGLAIDRDTIRKRRDIENRKIDCGRAHFDALGVDCEVATNIQEVLLNRSAHQPCPIQMTKAATPAIQTKDEEGEL